MSILAVASEVSESGIVWIVGALAALPTLLFCANQAKQLLTRKPALHDEFRLVRDCDSRCQTANERHSELARNVNARLTAMSENRHRPAKKSTCAQPRWKTNLPQSKRKTKYKRKELSSFLQSSTVSWKDNDADSHSKTNTARKLATST